MKILLIAGGEEVIYVVKSQSFLRTPSVSIVAEGEDWLLGLDETFDSWTDGQKADFKGAQGFPTIEISSLDPSHFQITIDLQDFGNQNPSMEFKDGVLSVTGTKTEYGTNKNENYLQSGINARGFRRSFQLSRGSGLVGNDLHHGILRVAVEQAVPAAMEPVSSWVRAG